MLFFFPLYRRQSLVAHAGLHVGRAASSCEAASLGTFQLPLAGGHVKAQLSVHQLSARGKILTWGRKHSPLWLEGGTLLR